MNRPNHYHCFSYSICILNHEYIVYTSCVLNQAKTLTLSNNHVMVVFFKFKSLRTPTFHAVVQLLNPAEFNLHVLDPSKEQQYVLNKFINICGCKWPNVLISLLIYAINIDRSYLQSNESDTVESTKLPRCLTLSSDHCTENPLIETY